MLIGPEVVQKFPVSMDLDGSLPHLQEDATSGHSALCTGIHNGEQKRSRENFTIWSSATLVDSDCLTVRPPSTVSSTLPYKEIYVWLPCPHVPQRHILIEASRSTSDKSPGDIGISQMCKRV